MSWYPEIEATLLQGNYDEVAQFYEQKEPESITHYWYLGLAYLLQEKEEEAQTTWLLAMSEGDEDEVEEWTEALIEILETEAQRQNERENYQLSWLIRGHIREIAPTLINNLLHLIFLSIELNCYNPEQLRDWQVIQILSEVKNNLVDSELISDLLPKVLNFPDLASLEFAQVSQEYLPENEFVSIVKSIAIKMANQFKPTYAADLTQICLERQPHNLSLLDQSFWFNFMAKKYDRSIAIAKEIQKIAETLPLKVYGKYQQIHVLIHVGDLLTAQSITDGYTKSLRLIIQEHSNPLEPFLKTCLQGMTTPLLYLQDDPEENRWLQNQLSRLFQENLPVQFTAPLKVEKQPDSSRPLKIGYIAHTLRRHSIGWLSRWLLHYRDKKAFSVALYLVNQPEDELTKNWFRNQADVTYNFPHNPVIIAQQIAQDNIDILMDLDSLTNAITCQVMALKPAPVQVTWLGFDASGIPAIDYYIADPYILPANAQEYYQEKIWRLPHSFLAVDGSEVAVPTLRREDLDIPKDSTIYLSVQSGLKRHPDTIHLQMKILKQVPSSYLLIQGAADEEIVKKLFTQIGKAEGVSSDRLRFIPEYPTEVYRANLAIADVVLDTYPFNGGTTTVDILWREIPVVTKVGQQWAARLGYSLLTNAGISEGIAWSDEEYIDWGVRLGTDENLRKQVIWQLKKGKKSAPLWNAKAFTQEMEKAYQQMWEIYCQSQKI